jgi:hypothetical protein
MVHRHTTTTIIAVNLPPHPPAPLRIVQGKSLGFQNAYGILFT